MMIAELENESNLSPIELAECLVSYVQEAARDGSSQYETERNIFDGVLKIGFKLMEQFLQLQGDGNLG